MGGKNSATPKEQQTPQRKPMHKCGDFGSYGGLSNKGSANRAPEKGKKRGSRVWERDHVPSKASLFKRAENRLGISKGKKSSKARDLYDCVTGKIEYQGRAIAIPRPIHRGYSRTCANRNDAARISQDANDPEGAIDRDADEVIKGLKAERPDCVAAYKAAIEKIKKHPIDKMIDDAFNECSS